MTRRMDARAAPEKPAEEGGSLRCSFCARIRPAQPPSVPRSTHPRHGRNTLNLQVFLHPLNPHSWPSTKRQGPTQASRSRLLSRRTASVEDRSPGVRACTRSCHTKQRHRYTERRLAATAHPARAAEQSRDRGQHGPAPALRSGYPAHPLNISQSRRPPGPKAGSARRGSQS